MDDINSRTLFISNNYETHGQNLHGTVQILDRYQRVAYIVIWILKNHMMFPVEKGGILNIMTRGIKSEPIVSQGISLSHILDKSSIQKIIENTWKKSEEILFPSVT